MQADLASTPTFWQMETADVAVTSPGKDVRIKQEQQQEYDYPITEEKRKLKNIPVKKAILRTFHVN